MKNATTTLFLALCALVVAACGPDAQVLEKVTVTFKNSQASVKSFTCTLSSSDNYLLENDTCSSASGVCAVNKVPIGKWNLLCTPTAASTKVALMTVDKVIDVKPEEVSSNEWKLDFEKGSVVVIGNTDGGPSHDGSKDAGVPDQKTDKTVAADTTSKTDKTVAADSKVTTDQKVTVDALKVDALNTDTGTTGKGTIVATVVDSSSGASLSATCYEAAGGTSCNASAGVCSLTGLTYGSYYMTCSASGYVSTTLSATLTSSSPTATLSFKLVKSGTTSTYCLKQLGSGWVISLGSTYIGLLKFFPITLYNCSTGAVVKTFQSPESGLKCTISKGSSYFSFSSNCYDKFEGLAAGCGEVIVSYTSTTYSPVTALGQVVRVHSNGSPATCP